MESSRPLRYRAALFDLDDTLFDHQFHRREALAAVRAAAGLPESVSIRDLELVHDEHLQRTHKQLLAGELSLEDARIERMHRTLAHFGYRGNARSGLQSLEVVYRTAYESDWRTVPGARELLQALKTAGVWIGVITNGRICDQVPKIERLALGGLLDDVIISEAVGAEKPSAEFFRHAYARAGAAPAECIVVGDLWETDIVGAMTAGSDAIWLNRDERVGRSTAGVIEVRSLSPVDQLLRHFLETAARLSSAG